MTAIALVQKLKNLPPVSQAALKLLSLLDRSSVDNDNIVQVLKYDNVLTAKLLRACNAPSFGLADPVASVDQAVLILGHQQILHIVMMLSFKGVMVDSSMANSMETDQLWEHSVLSAVAAETVLDQLPDLDAKANVAFTASLLHDIGKLVMARTLTTEEMTEIRDRAERKQIPGTESEREVVGMDHGEVGAALLKSWRLPEDIVEAVANHHRPVLKPEVRLSALVHVTNAIAHNASQTPGQNLHDLKIADNVATAFGINAQKTESMAEAVRKSSEQVERFMAMA
jgi:putative nucleotidyltransferase with HDIG domain